MEVITKNKSAMRPYSILAKNDAVEVALRLAHHTDPGAVDRLVLWPDNAYVTEWELHNAPSNANAFAICHPLCHSSSRSFDLPYFTEFMLLSFSIICSNVVKKHIFV